MYYNFHSYPSSRSNYTLPPIRPGVSPFSPFRGGGIAYLNDLDSYADWTFYTPGGASQVRQVEG